MRFAFPLLAVLTLLATPALAESPRTVLSPGEVSIGAEFFPEHFTTVFSGLDGAPKVSPSSGLVFRYATSHDLAVIGTVGFFHRFRKGDDPPTFWAVGGGLQYEAFASRFASVFLRGGLQFLPRPSNNETGSQDFGARFYAGPGVEARITEAFSLQFYTALIDLQVGGITTDFDIGILPSIGGYLYF